MTEARVNLHLRQDVTGVVIRQKRRLDLIEEVLTAGLGENPAAWWRRSAKAARQAGREPIAVRLDRVADLIETERL